MNTIPNPFEIILSELAELKTEIRKIRLPNTVEKLPDSLTPDQAISFLSENGYPTTKANIYKLSSQGEIPCFRNGGRLIFSRRDLLIWLDSRNVKKTTPSERAINQLSGAK